jgi:Cu(I)/Ag(I) efflux system membrane protein CusA/SilA
MTYEKLIGEMDSKLQFPGLTNTWTMPVQNRLDMALTGIKTPVGMKLQGANLEEIQKLGARVQQILSALPQVRSVFAERVSQGFYINVEVNRPEAAKYGLTIADVQQAVESGIGGMNVAENIEGRERYPINIRYQRDFRDNLEELSRVLIATPSGAQIPISEVAKVSFSRGPAMIRDEDGQLTGYIYIDLNTTDYGGFVKQASEMLPRKLQLPAGYTYQWSGEYEFQLRAKVRYIALFGIAVETGVVMVVYLQEALDKRIPSGTKLRHTDIQEAAIEGPFRGFVQNS